MCWDLVVGLEVHAQVISHSKLFSDAPFGFGAGPNEQVALLDIGAPGAMPVLNAFCVEQAVKTGLALGAAVQLYSEFDRKNYFYPDLPLGYQITQFFHPIATDGEVEIEGPEGCAKAVRIERIQLEQDAAKIVHDDASAKSYVDFNRAGVALMEIVSAPDMSSPEEVASYISNLRLIMRYVGSCDGDMEKGSLRCDANVSVCKRGSGKRGVRCEIKNLNSIRNVVNAVRYEKDRQIALLEEGGEVVQETRLFNDRTGETVRMRDKEDSREYRYFPDPDLPKLLLAEEYVQEVRDAMPELPSQKLARYTQELGLSKYEASVIIADKSCSAFFEQVASECDPKLVSKWLINELLGHLNKRNLTIDCCPISGARFAALLQLLQGRSIAAVVAKKVLDSMFDRDDAPEKIIESMGLATQESDSSIVIKIELVLKHNPALVEDYKGGKTKVLSFLIGQVMKETKGAADPVKVKQLLLAQLS